MNCRNVLVLAAAAFLCACGNSGIPGVSESHITANVPNAADFRPFLIRDLTQYLKDPQGIVSNLVVEYELLRDEPSQAGVGYPKFYLWLTATNSEKVVIEGAARVAAVDKKQFDILSFTPRSEIVAHPETIKRIFPKALEEKILSKASAKK